jgi:hypothetical protein
VRRTSSEAEQDQGTPGGGRLALASGEAIALGPAALAQLSDVA